MTIIYWLSTTKMTVGVEVSNGIITQAAPIVRKFVGQPIDNLRRWMKRQPGYREALLAGNIEQPPGI